jgi:trimeric autotransporter adhesin
MSNIKRANASSITKAGVAIADVPDAPTIGAVTDLGTGSTASVAYTAAVTGGTATTFTATSSPGSFTGTGSSPITVSGLSSGTSYTFTVKGSNSTGTGPASSASSSLTLAAVGVFESIATLTPSAGTTGISFNSIPQTYKSLQIRAIASADTGSPSAYPIGSVIGINGAGSANFAGHSLFTQTGSVYATGNTSGTYAGIFLYSGVADVGNANYVTGLIIDIIDYSSTTKNKTLRAVMGVDTNGVTTGSTIAMSSGVYLQTTAVTSLSIQWGGSPCRAGTTFALYGIKG